MIYILVMRPMHSRIIIALSNNNVVLLTGGLLFLCLLVNMTIIASPTPTPQTILIMSTAEPLSSLPADGPPGSQGASYLQQPPKSKAVEGEDVVFPCFLKRDVDEVLAVEKVRWYVQSLEGRKNVLQGNETVEDEFAGRVILSGDLSEGDLSMTLRNISVEDQGLYLCVFISTLNCSSGRRDQTQHSQRAG